MKSIDEIIKLSDSKFEAAMFLLEKGLLDDSYYLGGYVFELCLKAKICKTLSIPDFFDFESSKSRRLVKNSKGDKENLYKPFKVHDYEQLLILSGLFSEFSEKLDSDPSFKQDWSIVVKWNEGLRYSEGSNKKDVSLFLESIKNMKSWLLHYL